MLPNPRPHRCPHPAAAQPAPNTAELDVDLGRSKRYLVRADLKPSGSPTHAPFQPPPSILNSLQPACL